MAQTLKANTPNEIGYFYLVAPCPVCDEGLCAPEPPDAPPEPDQPVTICATCNRCGERSFRSFLVRDPDSGDANHELINPTDEPSELIDLGQWLGLFYHFVESSSSRPDRTKARRLGYRAALCLAEALKFYEPDDELPPESAFTSDRSREAYRTHPENFARQKLLDMKARLPSLGQMSQVVRRDQKAGRRKWWRFWEDHE